MGESIEYLAKAEDMADIRSIDGFVLLAAEQELLVGVVDDKPTAGSCCQVRQPLQMRDWQCHTCVVSLSEPSHSSAFSSCLQPHRPSSFGASLQQDGKMQKSGLLRLAMLATFRYQVKFK